MQTVTLIVMMNDANDDDADNNAVDGDEHKWKWLMMTTTRPSSLFGSCRLMLFVWCWYTYPCLYFSYSLKCISLLLSPDLQRVRRQSCPFALLYQIQYVVIHRCTSFVSFGTGATSASYKVVMIMVMVNVMMSVLITEITMRSTSGYDWLFPLYQMIIKIQYVVLASDEQYCLSQDPGSSEPDNSKPKFQFFVDIEPR